MTVPITGGRGMSFRASMIHALLAGTKSQTRRVLKEQPAEGERVRRVQRYTLDGDPYFAFERLERKVSPFSYIADIEVPFGQPGDLLWVREAHIPATDDAPIVYAADLDERRRWRSARFMARVQSRITLTITDVRVQRLHEITDADVWAEGGRRGDPDDVGGFFPAEEPDPSGIGWRGWDSARDWYADLWDQIHGEGAWDLNPWVAAISFTTRLGNIDVPEAASKGEAP